MIKETAMESKCELSVYQGIYEKMLNGKEKHQNIIYLHIDYNYVQIFMYYGKLSAMYIELM